mmetsp:Transcript_10744/g.26332  ORF Transcript_10744/g.26332 Transcript_10744/m.26332 type:complete len:544 (+) Transcript_10744:345-1976(+)
MTHELTLEDKKEIVKQMLDDDEEDDEPSDYDSDADGHLPPSKPVPASHWVRGALVRETMEVVDQMAKDGQIVKETHVGGKAKMSFIAPDGSKELVGKIARESGQKSMQLKKSMMTSRIGSGSGGGMAWAKGSMILGAAYKNAEKPSQDNFNHKRSSIGWGNPTTSAIMKMALDPTKPIPGLHKGADVKVALVGDLGTKCVAHLPKKWTEVALAIRDTLYDPDFYDDGTYAPLYIRNCIHSSLTYNQHDGTGGLEGATMRFRPERSDAHNRACDHVHKRIDELVKRKFPWASFADLFALAAYVVIECSGGPIMPLCVGRRDSDGKFFDGTTIERKPVMPGRLPMPESGIHDEELELKAIADQMRRVFLDRAGVTEQQMVCLILGGHSYGRCHHHISGYAGPWQHNPGRFNNMMAWNLLNHEWKLCDKTMEDCSGDLITGLKPRGIRRQYVSENGKGAIMMLMSDMCLIREPAWRKWVEIYAKDSNRLKRDFGITFKAATELGWKKPVQPETTWEWFKNGVQNIPNMKLREIAEFVCCREESYYR